MNSRPWMGRKWVSVCLFAAALALSGAAVPQAESLLTKVRSAYEEISAAKKLLHGGGQASQAQGRLSKAESELGEVRNLLPGSKVSPQQQAPATGGSGLSGLENEAEKYGENRLEGQAQSQSGAAASTSPLESAYQKVVSAEEALKAGKTSRAKSTLDKVPTLSSVERSVTHGLIGSSGSAPTP